MNQKDPLIGKIFGDYRIIEEIGRGGMGIVYLAEHTRLKELYALKILPPELAENKDFVHRFYLEAKVMARLSHPHITELVNMGKEEGLYYLVMRYIVGPEGRPKNLEALIREHGGKLPVEMAEKIARQISDALRYAHNYRDGDAPNGIIHLDLKPSNVLINRSNNVKLSDFGLAKMVGQDYMASRWGQAYYYQTASMGEQRPETQTGFSSSSTGSYDYLSPELRDNRPPDRRSDIYSLGAIIYTMLTGRKPVGAIEYPSEIDNSIPSYWDTIIKKCLQIMPGKRYQDVSELQKDIDREEKVVSFPDERPERLPVGRIPIGEVLRDLYL